MPGRKGLGLASQFSSVDMQHAGSFGLSCSARISMHARAHERTHPPRTFTMSPVIVRRGSTLLMTPVRAPAQQLVARERKVATSIAVTGAILFSA